MSGAPQGDHKRRRLTAGKGKKKAARGPKAPPEEDVEEEEEAEDDEGATAKGSTEVPIGSVLSVGTYEGGLLGLHGADGRQLFGFASHIGCIKASHCSVLGRMATGGTDHAVRLYDLAKGVELGELQEHANSVVCVEFWGTTTLVTGDDDGYLCVWRSTDWELLLKYRGHKTSLAAIAIHPSGRLMASAGRDRGVRLWDLTRGTSAANLELTGEHKESPEALQWSPSGDLLSVLAPRELLAVRARTGETVGYRDPNSSGLMRISLTASLWLSDSLLLLGDGKGDTRILELPSAGKGQNIVEVGRLGEGLEAASRPRARVKSLRRGGGLDSATLAEGWFAVGYSNGVAEIWSCSSGTPQPTFKLLRSVDTGIRLTTMALWPGPDAAAAAKASASKKAEVSGEATKEAAAPASPKAKSAAPPPDGEGGNQASANRPKKKGLKKKKAR
eukprot:TRINITY_DN22488_c0_g1_i1.p1 TRINITY_DN22488_c0_g1~~TRINITY_DN22488_c0_g1_i1.p1  ORF type:complete len:445 (-),score=97.26 TRINITY_DN22488_c0_g1_i1:116-1450(-)